MPWVVCRPAGVSPVCLVVQTVAAAVAFLTGACVGVRAGSVSCVAEWQAFAALTARGGGLLQGLVVACWARSRGAPTDVTAQAAHVPSTATNLSTELQFNRACACLLGLRLSLF
jgi:hypothetical protein